MKKIFLPAMMAFCVFTAGNLAAQTTDNKPETHVEQEKPPAQKSDALKEAEKNMEEAAASIQRSAQKIKAVVEERADKLAKTSQPAIESFLVASSSLIEQIARELEKMTSEKPAKKPIQ